MKFTWPVAAIAALGVAAAAYLYNEKRNAEPVDPAEAEAMVEQNDLNTQLMQDQLNGQLEERRAGEQERLDSPVGQALFASCLEWQEFAANHPGEEASKNRDAACDEFDQFLESGATPELPDDL